MIRDFHPDKDAACGAKNMGVWRFTDEGSAIAKFEQLRPLYPPYVINPPTERQLAAQRKFAELRAKQQPV
jgi:hypothetical protein